MTNKPNEVLFQFWTGNLFFKTFAKMSDNNSNCGFAALGQRNAIFTILNAILDKWIISL